MSRSLASGGGSLTRGDVEIEIVTECFDSSYRVDPRRHPFLSRSHIRRDSTIGDYIADLLDRHVPDHRRIVAGTTSAVEPEDEAA
jgi:hypothetical protein